MQHNGKQQEIDAYFDEFVDDERIKAYGKYFVFIADSEGNDIGSYMPAVNFFDAEKEYKNSELANSIARTLSDNIDDIFRLAGIDPEEGMKKPVSERAKKKPSQAAPKVDEFLDAVKTGNVADTIEGNSEPEQNIPSDGPINMPDIPFEFSSGGEDYKAVPDSDGRLEITRLMKSDGGTIAEVSDGLYFYAGALHRLDISGNDLRLSQKQNDIEQAIKYYIKQHKLASNTPSLLPPLKTYRLLRQNLALLREALTLVRSLLLSLNIHQSKAALL